MREREKMKRKRKWKEKEDFERREERIEILREIKNSSQSNDFKA